MKYMNTNWLLIYIYTAIYIYIVLLWYEPLDRFPPKKQQWNQEIQSGFDQKSAQKSRHKWDAPQWSWLKLGQTSMKPCNNWGLFSYQHHFPWGWEHDLKFLRFFLPRDFWFSLFCRERSHVTRQTGKGKSCWKDTLGGDMLVFWRVAICLFEDLRRRVDIVQYIHSQITYLVPFQIILITCKYMCHFCCVKDHG